MNGLKNHSGETSNEIQAVPPPYPYQRLPSYQQKYLLRYHPYPRARIPRREYIEQLLQMAELEHDIEELNMFSGPSFNNEATSPGDDAITDLSAFMACLELTSAISDCDEAATSTSSRDSDTSRIPIRVKVADTLKTKYECMDSGVFHENGCNSRHSSM